MNLSDVEQALTRKYGPLPGYVWAGGGALLLVLILRRAGGSSSSSSPAFLTTPPQAAVSGSDSLGAGGGGGGSDGSSVDPAISYGLPSLDPATSAAIDNSPASSSAPTDAPAYDNSFQLVGSTPDAAIAQGATAGDYFAANPLPPGTSTSDALAALGQFPAHTYDFSPTGVDFSAVNAITDPAVEASHVSAANTAPAITTAPSPMSLIELHYLHGRDPEA